VWQRHGDLKIIQLKSSRHILTQFNGNQNEEAAGSYTATDRVDSTHCPTFQNGGKHKAKVLDLDRKLCEMSDVFLTQCTFLTVNAALSPLREQTFSLF
jgi:hypothetical protein